jgi:hypothetical protein
VLAEQRDDWARQRHYPSHCSMANTRLRRDNEDQSTPELVPFQLTAPRITSKPTTPWDATHPGSPGPRRKRLCATAKGPSCRSRLVCRCRDEGRNLEGSRPWSQPEVSIMATTSSTP